MISISVRAFRGIEAADIQCSPLALICAMNHRGKSSLCTAVQAALTGRALLDEFEVKKAEAVKLVHDGGKAARVMVKSEDGEARMTWPSCEGTSEGSSPPHASEFAAGLVALPRMPAKERAAALSRYLKSDPSIEEVGAELRALDTRFTDKAIAALWETITKDGWDTAVSEQEERRRNAARDWCAVTGEKAFGSDKAKLWRPADWDEMMSEKTAASIEDEITEVRVRLEDALGKAAVDMAEMARLRSLSGELAARQEALATARSEKDRLSAELAAAEAKRAEIPDASHGNSIACPHCAAPITIERDGPKTILKKFTEVPPAENKRRRDAIATSEGEIGRLRPAAGLTERALVAAETAVSEAEAAQKRLAGLGDQKGAAGVVESIRDEVRLRELDLEMRQKMDKAETHHLQWVSADLKLKVVRPDGLRAKKLGEAVDAFNVAVLAPLCETAKFAPVTLTRDLRVQMGGRLFALLSESEQYRVCAILQIAMAKLDGSSMVVLDRADVLDSVGKNGLFRLLFEQDFPALIGMTLSKAEQAIDLSSAGKGATYWLVGGLARPLAEVKEEAA